MYAEARVKWSAILPEVKCSPSAVADMLDAAGLGHLDPDLKRELEKKQQEEDKLVQEEKLRLLDEYLRQALRTDETTEDILKWMQENVESTGPVACTLMRCVLESDGDQPLSAAKLCKQIEVRRSLLKKYNDTGKGQADPCSLARQAHCLFEVQRFCHDKQWPAGLMQKVPPFLLHTVFVSL